MSYKTMGDLLLQPNTEKSALIEGPENKKCTNRELNPGHNDGNVAFYL
jgi:hypothetical protein